MMNRETIVQKFNDHANSVLKSENPTLDSTVLDTLRSHNALLVAQMSANFEQALQPSEFVDIHIQQADSRFEQAYELMRTTFSQDVLESRESYISALGSISEYSNWWMIGRFWHTAGHHFYDIDGRLCRYHFHPITMTENIASVINANYMPLDDGTAIAGIGYLVTRKEMRGGYGHGRHMVEILERELKAHAEKRGERLRMIMLESELAARPFWYKVGYRYPIGSQYLQPPIKFDLDTGKPISRPVPELLMVKLASEEDSVSRSELLLCLKHLYRGWFRAECTNAQAQNTLDNYLFGELYKQFEQSLVDAERVELGAPPNDN